MRRPGTRVGVFRKSWASSLKQENIGSEGDGTFSCALDWECFFSWEECASHFKLACEPGVCVPGILGVLASERVQQRKCEEDSGHP